MNHDARRILVYGRDGAPTPARSSGCSSARALMFDYVDIDENAEAAGAWCSERIAATAACPRFLP